MKTMLLALAAACCLALGAGCDYPEQGCYALIAFDGYALPVASWPFMVEELVDDTGMTYGFNVLRPVEGELIELPLADASDPDRRAWLATVTGEFSGAGELDLTLSHGAELLSFCGAYMPAGGDVAPVYPVAGFVRSGDDSRTGRVYPNGGFPPLPVSLADARSFEVRRITIEDFEAELGVPVADAARRPAATRDALEVNAEIPEDGQPVPVAEDPAAEEDPEPEPEQKQPREPKDKQKTPPLGGRRQLRPR